MLLMVLKLSIAALILAVGMSARLEDIVYLWRRPVLLVKSIVAMYAVLPVVVIVMVRLLDLPPATEVALLVLAICAGAPLLPKKLIQHGGDPAYVFSLIVTTSLLAILTVPLSLHLLAGFLSVRAEMVTPSQVAVIILKSFLLPLGVGMGLRLAAPSLAGRIGDPLLKVAGATMALIAVVILVVGVRLVVEVGLPSLLAFGAFTVAAIVTGHLLGGPSPSDRVSLAIACASRHIGLALLIAANAPGRRALALVIAYLLASVVVSFGYFRWIKRGRFGIR